VWARIGLVNAVLVRDYAVDARKDAEEALDRAGSTLEPKKDREAIIAVSRSFLALWAGDRVKAKERADQAIGLTTSDASPMAASMALLASGRVSAQAGDLDTSLSAIDKALSLAPTHGLVVVDWAASRLEGGDPVSARRALSEYLQKHKDNSRARLLLAQAERALGDANYGKTLELACANDTKISRAIRTACALAYAEKSRQEGNRQESSKRAKAAIEQVDDSQSLGAAALLLASLGEVDEAENVLVRARKTAEPTALSLQWPDVAIRLARGESVPTAPILAKPAGPERVMVALRAAYARKGSAGLAAALKILPPGILDLDSDLRAYSVLAKEDAVAKIERAGLESRVEKGNPVAAYVLGVLFFREKDFRGAARRLEKAMANHGDACQAAKLYIEAMGSAKQGTQLNRTALKAVLSHNATCPVSSALN
jgi:tetratricopeptide (TPR) repeat protein